MSRHDQAGRSQPAPSTAHSDVPWADIETLFVDAGNVLVSIDFDRIAAELAARGIEATVDELRRAEAAARLEVSSWVACGQSTESTDSFTYYLGAVLRSLDARRPEAGAAALTLDLVPVLKQPGQSLRLWRWVLPGVPEALADLVALGLRLVVVSNSDGSLESGLSAVGLARWFATLVDSSQVGCEKPDPRIFAHALTVSGARPESTLHVGDLYHVDVVGARASGLHAVLVDPFDDWPAVDCERVRDLGELHARLSAARGLG